jgi:hypothetical protein
MNKALASKENNEKRHLLAVGSTCTKKLAATIR